MSSVKPSSTVRSSKRRSKGKTSAWTVPSVLVASTLVINTFDSCYAAPRPVQTADSSKRQLQRARLTFADVDDGLPQWTDEWNTERDPVVLQGSVPQPTEWAKRGSPIVRSPTRRSYSIATGSGIVVPSAFVSSIASSWDPRHRSIWFQRKAVIITSVFLAIFIVLIIGAAAFVRDKREADAEGEVDISDEAALKRMKEEREMRNGRKKGSKKKRGEKGEDGGGTKMGGAAKTTGIVLRWARVPTRKLKKRKTNLSLSQGSHSTESIVYDDPSNSPSPREESTNDVQSGNDTVSSGAQVIPDTENTQSRSSGSIQSSSESQGAGPVSSGRDTLSVADLTAAEAEMERQIHSNPEENVDAFPPAYISRTREELHPSANRQLAAGSSSSAAVELSGDEKRGGQITTSNNSSEDDSLPPMPFITETDHSSGNSQQHYSGHIATDDKNILNQLHHAASTPGVVNSVGGTASNINSSDESTSSMYQPSHPSLHASAPLMESSAPELDLTDEELNEVVIRQDKGKAASTLLPAPPVPMFSSNFSRFDMPYAMDTTTPTSMPLSPLPQTQSSSLTTSREKEQEAEQDRRSAMALLESKPEDMLHLPEYESQPRLPSPTALPSAPTLPSAPADEEEEDSHSNSSPSAPPSTEV